MKKLFLSLLVVNICACGSAERTPNQTSVASTSIDSLSAQLQSIDERLKKAEQTIFTISPPFWGQLDPSGDKGYTVVHTNIGNCVISIHKLSQRADGVSVMLSIGNTTMASMNNISVHAQYGPRFNSGQDFGEWSQKIKRTDNNSLVTLVPGKWNYVELNLPGIKLEEFGWLSISIDVGGISLRR